VPAVARALGVEPFPRTVGFALGDVRRYLKVEVLPRVPGELDIDGRRRVEEGMLRDRADEVGKPWVRSGCTNPDRPDRDR